MDASVTWKGGLSFDGTADTGFHLPLGAEAAAGGAEDGFRPMELILTGLAGCTAMDVISILQKKRQAVGSFDVQVHAERAAEHPKVFTRAEIVYSVGGQAIDEAAVVRAIELSATRYCPAQAMLGQVFPMELRYKIYEEKDGARELAASGTYALPAGGKA